MKKTIYHVLISMAIIVAVLLAACGKASHNHHLSGNWQIMSVEHLPDGSVSNPAQMYIAMNLHVVSLLPGKISGNMNYNHEEKKLSMDFPYIAEGEVERLNVYGIYSNPVVFRVEKLDGKQLVLRSGETLITCRRF